MTPPPVATARALARYQSAAVSTASPPNLVLMLYDRLQRDLRMAGEALVAKDLAAANAQLQHAQEIVLELRASLDTTAWDGAQTLAGLYDFLHDELVAANVSKDPGRIAACQALVEPLAEAWRSAAADAGLGDGSAAAG